MVNLPELLPEILTETQKNIHAEILKLLTHPPSKRQKAADRPKHAIRLEVKYEGEILHLKCKVSKKILQKILTELLETLNYQKISETKLYQINEILKNE